jgi:putative isomerase
MRLSNKLAFPWAILLATSSSPLVAHCAGAQSPSASGATAAQSRLAHENVTLPPESQEYRDLVQRLARGWNTWDVNSVTTYVHLPDGLAIHVGMKHNSTLGGADFLANPLIGRQTPHAEVVTPGPHSWDGSYTDLSIAWKGHKWRIQSAHDGNDLVLLATPLALGAKPESSIPPTLVFSVNYLWNSPGSTLRENSAIATRYREAKDFVFCTCALPGEDISASNMHLPVGGSYFAADFTGPVGLGTGRRRSLADIQAAIDRAKNQYEQSLASPANGGSPATAPMVGAIETTLGWDTIYDPENRRVISPITRVWSVEWGGWVLADWDNFFAATLAGVGSRDLAYANVIELLREETAEGFVPNYARPDGWKSFDRSEPPVGAITVLGLYEKYHDRWFLEDAFVPLLRWNRWWAAHRDIQGYLAWGSDAANPPGNFDDGSQGTRQGAIFESGLDNSPMYDGAPYDPKTHLVDIADVGLMSLYVADCDALASIADTLNKPEEARELRGRGAHYAAKLKTMWDNSAGIFLNRDLRTGEPGHRLSPTNFYPLLARVATPQQAKTMAEKHLLNPGEFWGEYVIPSIERSDPAFKDQEYWRGRIWGPMNYLVYLGLKNYPFPDVTRDFAQKSWNLFEKEFAANGHVHENYNAVTGQGDDVTSSDRFYHWGALLAYVEFLELRGESASGSSDAAGR